MMAEEKKGDGVIQVECPCCSALLWVDVRTAGVIQSEKKVKKKGSLDDLLLDQKKKSEAMKGKFEATFELQKKKLEQAKEKFAKALTDIEE
jgi:hypothetical protein